MLKSFRRAEPWLTNLKRQTPLPETADELCAVARSLGADTGEIHGVSGVKMLAVTRMKAAIRRKNYETALRSSAASVYHKGEPCLSLRVCPDTKHQRK
jgi:hypothetical protein